MPSAQSVTGQILSAQKKNGSYHDYLHFFFETFYKSFFLFNPTDRHINRSKSSNVPDYLHLEDKRY